MSEAIACPYCESTDNIIPIYIGGPHVDLDYSVYHCSGCDNPFMTRTMLVPQTAVLKLEGVEPVTKGPELPTMEEIQQEIEEYEKYAGAVDEFEGCINPDGEIPQSAVDEALGTCGISIPDPDEFHCMDCGFNYPIEMIGSHGGIYRACEADERTAIASEEYIPLPGSKTVSYLIKEDIVCLKYKDNCCGGYTLDVIWDIVDSPKPWTKKCDALVEGEPNAIQKASALNQFCKAIDRGDVAPPGVV
jgi:hypothetical protein